MKYRPACCSLVYPVKFFQVFSRPADDTDDPALKDAGLRTNFTLSGLEPYKHYDVAVQALTGAGGGEKSKATVMTDETGEPQGMGRCPFILLGTGWDYG